MDLAEIREIASDIRSQFLRKQIDEEVLNRLYHEYNPLENVNLFVGRAEDIFPNLNCGLTAVYLQYVLCCGRVVNGRYEKEDHTFLLVYESVVVDITADQYGGPEVYVGPLQNPWSI